MTKELIRNDSMIFITHTHARVLFGLLMLFAN